MGEYYTFLRDVYFFKDLSDEDIGLIEDLCKEDAFEAGDVIFLEGSRAEKFFIIIEGKAEVWKDYNMEEPDLLAVHGKGHLFGEMALIDDLPRSATMVAGTFTRVLFLYRDEFHQIIQNNSSVAISIIKSVSSMVRKSNESFVEDLRAQNRELEETNMELKAAQKELIRSERLSNLGKLSSLILHDIRNPVAVLKGYAELILLGTDQVEKVDKYAREIIKETERLNLLASELLDYSRGEIRLNMSIVEPGNFMKKVLKHIDERFTAKDIKIKTQINYHQPVIMDEERMLRVMLNLSDNARKAMVRGGEYTLNINKAENGLTFTVADTGEGMSPEVLNNIYEPFYSSSKMGGTGLGMVIVKNIVEAHHGDLKIESKERKGTTVTITLPLRS
jgi:signal transduction histidine kinase